MIEEKLKSLNITLPNPPKPAGAYIPVVKSEKMAFVSGQIPIENGKVAFKGKVPSVQSLEQAQNAA
ncbi:MAG TPA: RidA family protein, partial [Nitrosopumilaceae archaeon]|nr:RidA family protein [Nitrosopumilaceae archaeon]